MKVEEAAERLLGAFLVEFADRDDDEQIPLRLFLEQVAKGCNIKDFDSSRVPEWESVGELREQTRIARQLLAEGEEIQ